MRSSRVLFGLIAVLLILAAVGCGDDDNVSGPGILIPSDLYATWVYLSVTVNGEPEELGEVLEWHPGVVSAQFTLNPDGSFVYEELDSTGVVAWTEWGTFTIGLFSFTFTVTSGSDGPIDPPIVMSGTGTVNGNELNFTVVVDRDTLVFVATK